MKRLSMLFALSAAALVGWFVATLSLHPVHADAPKKPAPSAPADERKTADDAPIRKLAEAFTAAANARDAKAAAALWTEHGELTDPDGSVVRGRAELEKMYAEVFKTSPKGKNDIQIESVRLLGKNLATSEGTIQFIPADGKEPEVTKFSALHVREGDHWLTASVREWEPDPTELLKLADLAWIIGDWEAQRDERVVRTSYTWGDGKAFIQCRFQVSEKGQVVAAGTEILAKDPTTGQIRGWLFDQSGTLAEAAWSRDGNRWNIEIAGTLPDGSELSASNAIVPINANAFTWVSVNRTVAGETVPNVAPIKVTRVKK